MFSDNAFNKLKTSFDGELIFSRSPQYHEARKVFNRAMISRPSLIAMCSNVTDVIKALEFARNCGLRPVVRSGGHSVAGYSSGDGTVVLDVSNMRGIVFRPESNSIITGGGVKGGELVKSLVGHGVTLPVGGCTTVGLSGYTLGGGYSLLSRQIGLGIDKLKSLTLVDSELNIRRVNDESDAELMWALRGGGNGNFGVVVDMEYEAAPLGGTVFTHQAIWSGKEMVDALWSIDHYMRTAPNDFNAIVVVGKAAGASAPFAALFGVSTDEAVAKTVSASIDAFRPASHTCERAQWSSFLRDLFFYDNRVDIHHYWKTGFVDKTADISLYQSLYDSMMNSPNAYCMYEFEYGGGAISSNASVNACFAHRDEHLNLSLIGIWDIPHHEHSVKSWVAEAYENIRGFMTGSVYVNYPDPNLENWSSAYFGKSYPKLQQIKRRLDPNNVFRRPQGIEPISKQASD